MNPSPETPLSDSKTLANESLASDALTSKLRYFTKLSSDASSLNSSLESRSRGRLAPSPTGAQHIGNARTYLIAWLSMRSINGSMFLRIEDIDGPRTKAGAAEQAMDDLRWLGLDWDGEPVVQSQRMKLYSKALHELRSQNLVYPCDCSRSDVLAAASAPHASDEGPVYPRTCQNRDMINLPCSPYTWRFRANDTPIFNDGFRGENQRFDVQSAIGDFVVWKTEKNTTDNGQVAGLPAYQLAVVVDDALMGITHVIRGDDLLPSTPRQMLLDRALFFEHRQYAHVPLVVGVDGRRLAKRHGDTRLSTLRAAGVKPELLVGLLAWSCGWIEKIEPVSAKELIKHFQLSTIPREPFVLRQEHLSVIGFQ
jgi:glutamyl-tRNA synthetase